MVTRGSAETSAMFSIHRGADARVRAGLLIRLIGHATKPTRASAAVQGSAPHECVAKQTQHDPNNVSFLQHYKVGKSFLISKLAL